VPAGGERTFQVVVWLSERGLVLYVPRCNTDSLASSLIADLTGLDAAAVRCEIRPRRAHGFGGPAPLA
jgi:hypothetical protein